MAILNGYTTLAVLKARLGLTVADTVDDTELERTVSAVSREIDDYCGRRFYAVTETRYYAATRCDRLLVDDLISVATLATDEDGTRTYPIAWATTDYDLEPANAALEGEPYWGIRVSSNGGYAFPFGLARGVKILGSFGFAALTPAVIEDACLAQCKLEYDARSSASGMDGQGPATRVSLHPFVKGLLDPYRRISVG